MKKEVQGIEAEMKWVRMPPRPEKIEKKLGILLLHWPDSCCLTITPELANICLDGEGIRMFRVFPMG